MQITIITIGKALSRELQPISQEYEKRLSTQHAITWKLLSSSLHSNIEQAKQAEGQAIMTALNSSDSVILLDEKGMQQTNEVFAQTFERLASSQGKIVFVIGGAYGVSDAVIQRAQFVWSFSQLVFPHQLMRVMLLEQLYRTFTILQGHPYHHS